MSDKIPHPKRILIVDDHPIMRFGLARLIDEEPDLSVPWEAGTAREALTLLEQDRPDLVLIDMALPDRNGLELIKDIRAAFEGVQCLAISMHDEELYAER
ncbi:MAG: response regulator transcription factor, partial [Verrucomicrobiae bacterium]|nr:response regulator transcription factor [Verrucomicrobiae bacterium]